VLNYIWLALVVLAVAIGGWKNRLSEVTAGAFDGAKTAVTIALSLIGIMALWLGVMRLAERAGLVQKIARGLRPVMRRLFPDVPPEHPAMGSMLMNMAANMLGLGNAATPLGLRLGAPQSAARRRIERHVHFSRDQYRVGAINSRDGDRVAGRGRLGAPDGDRRHRAAGHVVRGDGGDYFSETPGETPVLSIAGRKQFAAQSRNGSARIRRD
jgi:hypothetical protein